MKFWNRIKHPLILTTLTLALAFLRYVNYTAPTWCPYFFWAPGLILQIVSKEIFPSQYVLLEAVFWPIAAFALLLVPAPEKYGRWRRFLIRPLLALLVILGLSNFAIASNEAREDAYWDKKVDAYRQEVSAFLDVADEVILHNSSTHNYSPDFKDERIRCECGTFHDVIMIDYETMRIAFLHHDGISNFFIYELQPGALQSENGFVQTDVLLEPSQTRLITYAPDLESGHRTTAIELILADGTTFSTTDTPDNHWDNAFLALYAGSGDHFFRVGEPHPKAD